MNLNSCGAEPTFAGYCAAKKAKITQNLNHPANGNIDYYPPPTGEACGEVCIHDQERGLVIYRHGDPELNNNGAAVDEENYQIVCRQLAFDWLCQKSESRTSTISNSEIRQIWRQSFATVENIERITPLKENAFDKNRVMLRADEYHEYNREDGFGASLYKVVQNIRPSETKSIMFVSENHAMAIEVRYKPSSDAEPARYVISFFDPNNTIANVRVVCERFEDIKNISLSDVLYEEDIQYYFPKFKGGTFAVYNTPTARLNPKFIQHTTSISDRFKNYKIDRARLNEQLYFALDFNHYDFLIMLINYITNMDVKPIDKLKLLEVRSHNGLSGLVMSALKSYPEYLRVYVDTVLSTTLCDEDKCKLIQAADKDGMPILSMLLSNQNCESLRSYVDAVLGSTLRDEDKFRLIQAADKDGMPILSMLLSNQNCESLCAYVDAVLGSTLRDEDKLKLIQAADKEGTPALFILSSEGYSQSLRAYVDAVLGSTLRDEDKFRLIQAADKEETPALFILSSEGSSQSLRAYVDAVLGSTLRDEDKFRLIQAADKDGMPAFFILLLEEHVEALGLYMNAVLQSQLSDEYKLHLLKAEYLDTTALSYAYESDKHEIVAEYLVAIQESTLTVQQKAELLSVIPSLD